AVWICPGVNPENVIWHASHMVRALRRVTSSSSGTSKSITTSSVLPSAFSTWASPSACGTVRTTPSRIRPRACWGAAIVSRMIPMITSSGTRSPRSYAALALRPSGVRAAIDARITSPVEIFGMPRSAAIRSPCVPLPEPGGPSSTTIIGRSLEATLRAPAEPHAPLLHEAVVLPQQQVLLHLRERVERNTDHDEQRRSAEAELH